MSLAFCYITIDTTSMFLVFFSAQEVIGLIAGFLTASSLLPQLLKIFKEKKAENISIPMLLILLCGLGLWIYYGAVKEDWPIIITNAFSFLLNVGIIILKFKYKQAPAPKHKPVSESAR